MAEPLVDVDLDALAPAPKRTRLGGKVYLLPGDMPLPLFFKIQTFEQRVEKGEDEIGLLTELQSELLDLFQVHNPQMKALPPIGVLGLMGSLGAIYGGGTAGEPPPNRATRRQKKRTPSQPATARAKKARTSA